MPKFLKVNQAGIAHLIPLLIILIGIIAGVYLVKHPQIFKPKAYEEVTSPPVNYASCGDDSSQLQCPKGSNCVEGSCLIREEGI